MTAIVPTALDSRLDSLDLLRGVAVLGILLMNIIGFGLPLAYEDPMVSGGVDGAHGPNFIAWLVTSLFFEGTMRGLFTMLFGAGVVLFTSRLERAGVAGSAGLHVRRMLWLVAFGFVDSHLLLWAGDILYEYGLVGLVLYAFRKVRPRVLLVLASLVLTVLTGFGIFEVRELRAQRAAATEVVRAAAGGVLRGEPEREALQQWADSLAQMRPPAEELAKTVEAMRGGFASAWPEVTSQAFETRTAYFFGFGFFESIATMMIGMALFALGALQGRWPARRYAALAIACYAVGLGVNVYEAFTVVRSGFDPLSIQSSNYATYELGRVPTTLGHLGLVLLLWKVGAMPAVMRRLAAVGRMALTNYLAQSLIGLLVFTGVGFGLFGQLERYQLYYVVIAVWILQLLWSPWWMSRYRHGPAEWLWRSLTYRQPQKLRKTPARFDAP